MLDAINNRELSVMEVLACAIRLFTVNFKHIFKILVFIFLPLALLNGVLFEKLNTSMLIFSSVVEMNQGGDFAAVWDAYIKVLSNQLIQVAIVTILEPIGVIAVAKVAKNHLTEEPISVTSIIGESMNCLGRVILTGIPYFIVLMLGIMLFVFPGIYVAVIWTFYVYAIGLRDEKGMGPLRYSKSLVRGRWWKTMWYIIVFSFFAGGWNWAVGTLLSLAGETTLINIISYWVTYFTAAIGFIFMVVFFLNREALVLGRKECVVIPNAASVGEEKQ